MAPTYITSMGVYLPGEPVSNDAMGDYLGVMGERGSRIKKQALKLNGIRQRYYAIDKNQKTLLQSAEMAARAIQCALSRRAIDGKTVEYIATATTQADHPVPGFASQVHAHLPEIDGPEIASFQSVCSSGLMAIKGAYLQIKTGEARTAVACASEMPSRLFKASRYTNKETIENGSLPYDVEFLRWMLSDGAGACVIQDRPARKGLSLRIEWIEMRSLANKYPLCMYYGPAKDEHGVVRESWLDPPDYNDAQANGYMYLRQDLRLLPEVIKSGVEMYFDLIAGGKLNTDEIDYFCFHYSSEAFKPPLVDLLQRGGAMIPAEKWFTNLHTKGNTGSASIFIMLEELFNKTRLVPGQKILCGVPESGRFNLGFMLLTVVDGSSGNSELPVSTAGEVQAPKLNLAPGPVRERLVRELTNVWLVFERELILIPILSRIHYGGFSIEDYRTLLQNFRAQVVDGSRWIARAASNLSDPRLLEVRSLFIHHAKDEHRDYRMLEEDFVSIGGRLDDIVNHPKNIGTEALSAWMFHRASRENPIDLLGAMFIIEGMGARIASRWGTMIREQLGLREDQVSFLLYHGTNDANHFDRLEQAVNSDLLTDDAANAIVKTAKVTARLYRLQIEELGNV